MQVLTQITQIVKGVILTFVATSSSSTNNPICKGFIDFVVSSFAIFGSCLLYLGISLFEIVAEAALVTIQYLFCVSTLYKLSFM